MKRVVVWDFDGTLAERPGMFGECLLETLDEHEPGHGFELEAIRPFLRNGFPWHEPERAHPELCAPGAWWAHVRPLLAAACVGLGLPAERAATLALAFQKRYLDPRLGWSVFADTFPALTRLRDRGWRHVLLSNHVPELPALVEALGLTPYFDAVLTSATIGFEKPHAEAFACALRAADRAGEVWMVGDNYLADVAGAEAVGLPAVLVRKADERARRAARTLDELDAFLG